MSITGFAPDDVNKIEKFVHRISNASGVYIGCFGTDCKRLVDYSTDAEVNTVIRKYVTKEMVGDLYNRVVVSNIEDQVVDNTDIPEMKVAACSVKVGGVCRMFYVLCYIEKGFESDEEDFKVLNYRTEYRRFLDVLDVIRTTSVDLLTAKMDKYKSEELTRQSVGSAKDMEEALVREKTLSQVLKLLDYYDKKTEMLMAEFLDITSRFLDISHAVMVKIVDEEQKVMDVPAQWNAKDCDEIFTRTHNQKLPSFIEGVKPLIFSSNSRFLPERIEEWDNMKITALAAIPIPLVDKTNLFAVYIETRKEKIWKIEELQLLADSARVLLDILEKRIDKNSILSSYSSLEEILEHVGCAIVVLDNRQHEILFRNQRMKDLFSEKKINPDLQKLLMGDYDTDGDIEFYDYNSEKYYDIHHNNITWLDGRLVALHAIYDVTDKKNYQRRIEQQAYTDFLTGLFNRMCCERDLARLIDDTKKSNKQGALLYLDLDDFKHINDGLGHQWGDVLLKDISSGMRSVKGLEESCYRMGGDEFVIIVRPGVFDEFERILEEIKHVFATPFMLKEGEYYCTMSMGMVVFPDEGDTVNELIQKADVAMYEAKKSGKNRVAKYVSGAASDANKRLDMEKNMRKATAEAMEEFLVYYQPIIDISREGNPCAGAEALVRWDSNEMGFVVPADFIPLAESLGLIDSIGEYVLEKACKTLKYWNDNGYPEYMVNVNLSVVQLMQNDIVERIEKIVRESGINPSNLTLEVTESLAINDMERMKSILDGIKEMGIKIALDDFGTGYSSLNHIREIPLNELKVDRSFVQELAADEYSKSFIRMVSELAGAIDVYVCVEGIETEEQYKILEDMQVRLVQGYYFDRPLSEQDFNAKYVTKTN